MTDTEMEELIKLTIERTAQMLANAARGLATIIDEDATAEEALIMFADSIENTNSSDWASEGEGNESIQTH